MNRQFFAAVSLLALASCSGGNLAPVAASLTPALLPEQVATLRQICQAAAPALAVAVNPALPAQVTETAVYPKAYCDQLLAGTVPPTTDADTPSWLPSTLAALKTAAQIAGVVLPLVL